jgi:hypothetical protein
MIRRDYILRMIEEFVRALARIESLKHERRWSEAETNLDDELKRLVGTDRAGLESLNDTALLARILRAGDFNAQRAQALMVARLLSEAADVTEEQSEAAQVETDRAGLLRLRALKLMLNVALRSEGLDWPDFVPTIDIVAARFKTGELPLDTQGLLMQHFERTGQYAKAEDSLWAALEFAPDNPILLQLGISFYRRLLAKSDAALEAGNLPRAEVQSGLDELQARAS